MCFEWLLNRTVRRTRCIQYQSEQGEIQIHEPTRAPEQYPVSYIYTGDSVSYNKEHFPRPRKKQNDSKTSKTEARIGSPRPALKPEELPDSSENDEEIKKVINEIDELFNNAKEFDKHLENFNDVEGSQQHYFIEESLTRIVLKLDRLRVEHSATLRAKRREVIKYIYQLFDKLKKKTIENNITE
ncbi:uncharacterized protein [Leptinotarsa decemlineata]|uniref:uncharacterized protein n=1 Tax=Leptinotarsa decemlineata TaxID=7539 RepID=UPI003D307799